ncbi:hypothetical protein PR202_gb08218 [Eleusine coracana subsp. coracana]|uniref:Uncharacterized protein n=1 Tax=Eleusine coracana subsp. coracana TaxID=191504 RepID=A0AAV5EEA5_ELECO|nr:hypothetical protein PR202_gb08218 [Eleusine coracana subsp. coracana]
MILPSRWRAVAWRVEGTPRARRWHVADRWRYEQSGHAYMLAGHAQQRATSTQVFTQARGRGKESAEEYWP